MNPEIIVVLAYQKAKTEAGKIILLHVLKYIQVSKIVKRMTKEQWHAINKYKQHSDSLFWRTSE